MDDEKIIAEIQAKKYPEPAEGANYRIKIQDQVEYNGYVFTMNFLIVCIILFRMTFGDANRVRRFVEHILLIILKMFDVLNRLPVRKIS